MESINLILLATDEGLEYINPNCIRSVMCILDLASVTNNSEKRYYKYKVTLLDHSGFTINQYEWDKLCKYINVITKED